MHSDANFYAAFKAACERAPAAACIETEGGVVYSYADIDRMSAQFANALRALGCERDDRVAVQIEKSAQALALFLGALRAGLIYLPLNTAYKASELAYFLSDAQPQVFVCGEDVREATEAFAKGLGVPFVVGMDSHGEGSLGRLAAGQSDTFETVHRTPDDIATIMYTSGTTGRSKGAMLTCRAVNSCAEGLASFWEFSASDVLLHALPIFHVHGLFVSTCVALLSGAKLLFHRKFDVDATLTALPRATVMMAVPTFYHRLLADPRFTREVCSTMRLFTSGSAPLTAQVHAAFAERCGHRLLERYGATETMILTSNPLHGERRPGSVGMPIPGVDLRICDKTDQPVPRGEIGMIQVRGPGLFAGYWRSPEKSAEDLTADGYFRTGDLGEQSADGYVMITGRAKDLIISGGYNVYPVEVEFALDEHEAVAESAVIGIPHPDFGESVAAVVTLRPGKAAVTSLDLISWIKSRLANYKVPKQLVIVDQLPRNALGKVQKNVLRETFRKLGEGA